MPQFTEQDRLELKASIRIIAEQAGLKNRIPQLLDSVIEDIKKEEALLRPKAPKVEAEKKPTKKSKAAKAA
jgi:hypothetical protein